jgi:hypothetical protein
LPYSALPFWTSNAENIYHWRPTAKYTQVASNTNTQSHISNVRPRQRLNTNWPSTHVAAWCHSGWMAFSHCFHSCG